MFLSRARLAISAGFAGIVGGVTISEYSRHLLANRTVKAAELIPVTRNDLSTNPNRTGEIMRHGFPGTDNIRYYSDFVLSYDQRNRTANWVMEHLTAESVKKNKDISRKDCDFHEDSHFHPYFRSQNGDYLRSGFDRGHLAAAGNHQTSQQALNETFFLSNISPQVGKGFNRDSWNRLEQHVRRLTLKYRNVYVCTGPLYLPRKSQDGHLYVNYRVLGPNHVAVPTHFFKVALCEDSSGELDMEAYVMPNAIIDDSTPLEAFQVPLDAIERPSGLLLFRQTEKLRRLNGHPAPKQLRPAIK